MGTGYLLANNVVIDYSSQKLPSKPHLKLSKVIDKTPTISIISKIELLSLPNTPKDIIDFVREALVISLEENIIDKTIDLRKKYRIKLPDAIIVATALIYNLTLVTHNIRDFQSIKRLNVVDSHLFI
jgi:predicted nucleic acid-binding protein